MQPPYPPPHPPHHGFPLPHGQAPYGPPQRYMCGVLLEPGERVLYFRPVEQMVGRIANIVLGILLTPFIVGLVLLYATISGIPKEPDAQAVTNRRLLSMKRDGRIISSLRWEEIVGFTKVFRRAADPTMMVRNAQGPQIHFAEDGRQLEPMLAMWRQNPAAREQAPEVPFF